MRKEHHQRYYESSDDIPDDPDRYIVTRDDLEGDEIRVYDHYLARLDHPSPDQLRMLAVYSWLAVKFKQAAENKKLALYIHRCMLYCRNRLGLWKPEPVEEMELLLDDGRGFERTFYCLYLDQAWKVGEDDS
jgi:hypothetical protein